MKALLLLLFAGALGYAYLQQQKVASLERDLQAARAEAVQLKRQLDTLTAPSSEAPGGASSAQRPRSGSWMWQERENPLAPPAPSQNRK
jgi:hypothetical protein